MKIYQFRLLSQDDQVEALQKDGVFIGKKRYGRQIRVLFQLDSFYVEVIYTKYRVSISHFRCFTSVALIEPYLDQIRIKALV